MPRRNSHGSLMRYHRPGGACLIPGSVPGTGRSGISTVPHSGSTGGIRQWIGVTFRDVTDENTSAQRLVDKAAEYSDLYEEVPVAGFTLSSAGSHYCCQPGRHDPARRETGTALWEPPCGIT